MDDTSLVPSNEEKVIIRERIYHARHALQQAADEKAMAVRREKKLSRRAIKLEKQIQYYSRALAPHQRLPQDVLRCIFKHRSEAVRFPNSIHRLNRTPQRILLRVCSSWRQVALHTPQLWNDVVLRGDYCVPAHKVASAAHMWLSLGKAIPGRLEIINHEGKGDLIDVILDLITTYKPRELVLTLTKWQLRKILELPRDAGLSCIQDLYIKEFFHSFIEGSNDVVTPLDFSEKFTGLKAFRKSTEIPGDESIPWHQLQLIDIQTSISDYYCLDIVRRCSAVLETCHLSLSDCVNLMGNLSTKLIYCVNLQHLEIRYHVYNSYDPGTYPVLSQLQMPRLKSLHISGGDPCFSLSKTLVKIQEQSGMSLEELVVRQMEDELDIGTLLRTMPSLRRIDLSVAITLDDKTIEELSSGLIGYYLEEITIWKDFSTNEIGKVLQMVEARAKSGDRSRSGPSSFKVVELSFDRVEARYTETIRKIRMLGVQFYLHSTSVTYGLSLDEHSESESYDLWK